MSTRREFLKQAGTMALGAPFLMGRNLRAYAPSCVVIGAGLAGLAAAYRLKEAGWSVTVLESRDRLGGRVLTHRLPENTSLLCELGAEWVGASHQRIRGLCSDFGIPLVDHRFANTLLRDGELLRPGQWKFSDAAVAAFDAFKRRYPRYTEADKRRLDAIDWWTFLEKIGFTQEDLRLRDLLDSTDFGESIRHVSAYAAASEYLESSPENEMDFKMVGGNSRLIEELARRVGAESIQTGLAVTEIRQRNRRVAVVAGSRTFAADACICTIPARMLSHIHFDPQLPAAQAAAADQLQYARIAKSSVLYAERFWDAKDFSLTSDRTSHYYFHSTREQTDERAKGGAQQGILTSYAIGEKADVLAAQSNARRTEIITDDLRAVDSRAPQLARGIATYAWQRDVWTGGAYALYRPGQWFGLRPVLARPHGSVLFAGEHLAEWQGFMEGAVVTGEDAADRLIRR